jgi:hypothetical protein
MICAEHAQWSSLQIFLLRLGICAASNSAYSDHVFWLPRVVDFKISCSQIPRRAFEPRIRPSDWESDVLTIRPRCSTSNTCMHFTQQAFQLHHVHLVFFSLFWGHVFSAFQHNLGTFCHGELLKLVWISVAKIWSRSVILLFPQENCTFGISGIKCMRFLGADWAFWGAENASGVNYPLKKFCFSNLGTSCIPYSHCITVWTACNRKACKRRMK